MMLPDLMTKLIFLKWHCLFSGVMARPAVPDEGVVDYVRREKYVLNADHPRIPFVTTEYMKRIIKL